MTTSPGSASIATNASGAKVSELRYKPYGEVRYAWNQTVTDKRFTGQRQEEGLGGIHDYNARYFDPVIGRFISADSIVPRPSDPQSLNRFSYVRNSPLTRVDPNGHADKNPFEDFLCDWVPQFCQPSAPPVMNEAQMNEGMSVQQVPVTLGDGTQVTFFAAKSDGGQDKGKGGGGLGGLLAKLLGGGGGAGAGKVAQELSKDGDPTNEIQQAGETTVQLFRAVSQAEYDDIMQSGALREAANSVSGKYFATKAEHAAEWGRRMYGGDGFRVIAVDFPKRVVEAFDTYWRKLDGIGPAYYARMEQLIRYTIVGEVKRGR